MLLKQFNLHQIQWQMMWTPKLCRSLKITLLSIKWCCICKFTETVNGLLLVHRLTNNKNQEIWSWLEDILEEDGFLKMLSRVKPVYWISKLNTSFRKFKVTAIYANFARPSFTHLPILLTSCSSTCHLWFYVLILFLQKAVP